MNTYLSAFFVLLSVTLGVAVLLLRRKLRLYEKRLEDLHQEKVREHADSIHLHVLQETLWQSVNTIHLLAALSEEESSSQELKEKQRMILTECGKIGQQL